MLALAQGILNLSAEHWFREVLRVWGRSDMESLTHHISQHDAAEFVSSWIDQMRTRVFQMGWERRLENEGRTELIDESVGSCPIHLQFTPFQLQLKQCSLQSLINTWHQAHGMVAALLHDSVCLCVHIERCIALDVPPYVSRCLVAIDPEEDCAFSVFSSSDIETDLLEYTVVAAQAHVGSDNAGHYRTALRILPSITRGVVPSAWLLCDDGQAPEPVWMLPRWFMQHMTLVWLVRSELIALHGYADAVHPPEMPAAETFVAASTMPTEARPSM